MHYITNYLTPCTITIWKCMNKLLPFKIQFIASVLRFSPCKIQFANFLLSLHLSVLESYELTCWQIRSCIRETTHFMVEFYLAPDNSNITQYLHHQMSEHKETLWLNYFNMSRYLNSTVEETDEFFQIHYSSDILSLILKC